MPATFTGTAANDRYEYSAPGGSSMGSSVSSLCLEGLGGNDQLSISVDVVGYTGSVTQSTLDGGDGADRLTLKLSSDSETYGDDQLRRRQW